MKNYVRRLNVLCVILLCVCMLYLFGPIFTQIQTEQETVKEEIWIVP